MNKNTALAVAGVVFGLVALMHILRVFFKLEITIGGLFIPMWASILGFVIALALSIWMFRARG